MTAAATVNTTSLPLMVIVAVSEVAHTPVIAIVVTCATATPSPRQVTVLITSPSSLDYCSA